MVSKFNFVNLHNVVGKVYLADKISLQCILQLV